MYSPILHPASGIWMLGVIEKHTAKPLSRGDIEALCAKLNAPSKVHPTGSAAAIAAAAEINDLNLQWLSDKATLSASALAGIIQKHVQPTLAKVEGERDAATPDVWRWDGERIYLGDRCVAVSHDKSDTIANGMNQLTTLRADLAAKEAALADLRAQIAITTVPVLDPNLIAALEHAEQARSSVPSDKVGTVSVPPAQKNQSGSETPPVRLFKKGDTVLHVPSGETWYLIDDERETRVFPGGYPKSMGFAYDCKLITPAAEPFVDQGEPGPGVV